MGWNPASTATVTDRARASQNQPSQQIEVTGGKSVINRWSGLDRRTDPQSAKRRDRNPLFWSTEYQIGSKGATEQPKLEETLHPVRQEGKPHAHSQDHHTKELCTRGEPRQAEAEEGYDGGRKAQNKEEDSRRFEMRGHREEQVRVREERKRNSGNGTPNSFVRNKNIYI